MRVVRWDQRGFGETPHVPGSFSYSADVLTVMDGLGIEQAVIMGCSMGGATAIKVAVEHPERVTGLVLSGPGVPGYDFDTPADLQELFAEGEQAFAQDDADRALKIMEKVWLIGPGRSLEAVDPAYLARARELLRQADRPDEGAESLDVEWSAQGRLESLAAPTLVIVGSEDVAPVLQGAAMLGKTLPNARYEVIDNAAHLPNLERPRQFDALLSEWLGDVVPQPDPE
jgi:pimeloyl-ACP methyl ester carboxylesterase